MSLTTVQGLSKCQIDAQPKVSPQKMNQNRIGLGFNA